MTYLCGPQFERLLTSDKVTFAPLTGQDDPGAISWAAKRASVAPGPEQLAYDLKHVFFDAIPGQHRALQELLAVQPDLVLLADTNFLGPWATRLGGPGHPLRRWISVGISPVYAPSDDTTPFGPVPVPTGGDPAAANRAAFAQILESLGDTQSYLETVLGDLAVTDPVPEFFYGAYSLPDRLAQLSVPEFEFPRSDTPGTLAYIGLLPVRSPAGWREPDWWADLDGPRPVVVVTQGTLANNDLAELIAPTLTALADEEVLVVAALGPGAGKLSIPVPPNARVQEYVPFDRLLPRADLLVTNGGFGATQHALAAGIPVVVAGASEDKPAVAARIAFHQVGANLGTATPTADAVRTAVLSVLSDPGTRQRSRDLAGVYDTYAALDLVEAMIDPDGHH